jgi:hypothetical protein
MTAAVTASRAEEPSQTETIYITPQIPSEEAKIAALKLAYKINGNSMVGHNEMIDLTKPIPVSTVKIPASEVIKSIETTKPVQKAEVTDTCTRHGMHKVIRGSSWRCKR